MATLALAAGASALTSAAAGTAAAAVASTAVVGLGSLGTITVGGLATFAAPIVGGIIDQAIFGGGQSASGPRLESLSVTTGQEGEPLPRIYGTMRCGGRLIWALSKREVSREVGGKGGALGGGSGGTAYDYIGNFALAFAAGTITSVGRAWAGGEAIALSEYTTRFYPGTPTQAADALIVAAESAAPAYRGTAYMVFEELNLARFGQALPQVDLELTRRLPAPGLRGIVEQICADFGVPVEASGVSEDADVIGYRVEGQMTALEALDPLRTLFRLDVIEDAGRLVIRSRSAAPVAEIAESVMAERDSGSAVTLTRRAREDEPERVTLAYIDPTRAYAPGSATFSRGAGLRSVQSIQFPGALDARSPSRLVAAAAVQSADARSSLVFDAGLSQLALAPGDVVTVRDGAASYLAQIGRQTIGDRIAMTATTLSARPSLADGSAGFDALIDVDGVPDAPVVHYLDLPMLTDDEADPHRPWVAADASVWVGVSVYRDVGAGYAEVLGVPRQARIGTLEAALPIGATGALDTVSEVDVTMRRGGFESVVSSTLEDAPINALAVRHASGEWEVLQFATATLVAGNRWRLTDLRRGRRGTEHAMGAAIGAPLVVLDDGIFKLPILPEQIGTAFAYRAGPAPVPNDDPRFSGASLTFAAVGLRPYAPVGLSAVQGMTDITLSWTGRARVSTDPASKPDVYDVRIYDGATVLRTYADVAAESLVYPEAAALADHGGAPSEIDFGVTPKTAVYGAGIEARATLTL